MKTAELPMIVSNIHPFWDVEKNKAIY